MNVNTDNINHAVRADRFRTLAADRYDVIVVGAGLGGLTAAALLATRGRSVLVLDQHYVAGGNATVFRRRGYEFDVGLHYIGGCEPGGPIPRILQGAGAGNVVFEQLDPDGYDTLVFPDVTIRIPKGEEAMRARLLSHFPNERRGIDRFLSLVMQVKRMQSVAANPISALWTVPRSLLVMRYATSTFGAFLASCTDDPRLRAVLAAQCGDYALPPNRASALMGAGLVGHYLDGAYFPRGGGQVLSDRLAEAIEAHGGKILLRARVSKILVEHGRAAGVVLSNKHTGERTVRADVVISNADLKRTMTELVGAPHMAQKSLDRTRSLEMAPALGAVYLGVRRNLMAEGHPATNYWIYPDWDIDGEYARVARGETVEQPFAFISIASVKDPTNRRIAPDGVTNMQVMGLASSSPEWWGVRDEDVRDGSYGDRPDYLRVKERFAERLIDTAERVFPWLRDAIEYREVATPLTHSRFTGSSGGTSYGLAATPSQFLKGRPGARTEIDGLYLCGASCRTGHGIGGVMMSGLVAAGEIAGKSLMRDLLGGDYAPAAVDRPLSETDAKILETIS